LLSFFAVIAALAVSQFASAATPAISPAVQASLDARLATLAGRQPGRSPGLQVAIFQGGEITYDNAFGHATIDTRFPIGSITKMFTAVAVMQLVEQKRVDLDAKVATYLPNAPYATQITVRQLLQHTSGLWNYVDYAIAKHLSSKPTTTAAILSMVAGHPLTATPGTKYEYSNSGYVVLGLIVEHVAGETLAEYDRDHIFQAAGMTHTTVGTAPFGAPAAAGYMSADGPRAPSFDWSWAYGCGDIISTAGDLAKFDIALLGGHLVSSDTFGRMQTDRVTSDIGGQGLGLQLVSSLGVSFVGHHGGLPGFEAENETIPSQQMGWVVLSNAFDFETSKANRIVFNELFPMPATSSVQSPEDAAITQRFRATLAALTSGVVDRTQLSDAVNTALTPQVLAQTAAQLTSFGSITQVRLIGSSRTGSLTVYDYAVSYTKSATLTWHFIVDDHGKISGIGSR
jgi:CubicO group peptidase (beta-lactamase class C family)